jgi:hypothetical protein
MSRACSQNRNPGAKNLGEPDDDDAFASRFTHNGRDRAHTLNLRPADSRIGISRIPADSLDQHARPVWSADSPCVIPEILDKSGDLLDQKCKHGREQAADQ